MPIAYDPTTPQGKVRLLCFDTIDEDRIFQDEEIQAFLDLNDQSIRLAAAQALEHIAAKEVYLQKVIKTLDIASDGAKEASTILTIADRYRQEEFTQGPGLFDYAEMVYDPATMRERVRKEFLREMAS